MAEHRASIDIAAPPETVYDYLVTEAGMTAWMGQYARLDARPGGQFAVDIAGYPIRGEYIHLARPSRVTVSWGVAGSAELPTGASTVNFQLTAIENGTRVDLTHSGLPDDAAAGYASGWRNFLPRLATIATGGDPGPDRWNPNGDDGTDDR